MKQILDNSQDLYKLLIDTTVDWETLLFDDELVYVSPSCTDITGYSREEFIKDKNLMKKIIHPDDLSVYSNHLHSDFAKEEIQQNIIFRIITKKKETKWIEHICHPIHNSENKFIGIRASNRDITEKKILELQDKVFINLLSVINSSDSIVELIDKVTKLLKEYIKCDAVGIRLREGHDYPYFETIGFPEQFVRAERYLCEYDHQGNVIIDSKGDPVLECMCGNILCGRFDSSKSFFTDKGSYWSNCTTELLATTTEKDRQNRTRNRCNGEGYESVGLFALRSNNTTFGLIQINNKSKNLFTDNTITFLENFASYLAIALHSKYMDIALKESEDNLKNLNYSKDRFFSIIAHDLKSPLASILGLSGLLNKNLSNNNIDKAISFATHIEQSAKATFTLLENLLEWAVSQQNEAQFKPELIDVNLFLLELLKIYNEIAIKKEIIISLECNDNIKVYADTNMVKSIVRNLITNAIKFSFKGGQINLNVADNQSDITISVADSGIGMDKITIEKLFKIDSTSTMPGTENEKGTGIGLLLCKEFVLAHNGKIWVESEFGVGSSFNFSLPKNKY